MTTSAPIPRHTWRYGASETPAMGARMRGNLCCAREGQLHGRKILGARNLGNAAPGRRCNLHGGTPVAMREAPSPPDPHPMTIVRFRPAGHAPAAAPAAAQSDSVVESRAEYRAAVGPTRPRTCRPSWSTPGGPRPSARPRRRDLRARLRAGAERRRLRARSGPWGTSRPWAIRRMSRPTPISSRCGGAVAMRSWPARLERNRELSRQRVAFELPRAATCSPRASPTTRGRTCSTWGACTRRRSSGSRRRAAPSSSREMPGKWAPLGMRVDPEAAAFSGWRRPRCPRRRLHPGEAAGAGFFASTSDRAARRAGTRCPATGRAARHRRRGGDPRRRRVRNDSRAPVIYRMAAGGDSLERFLESPLFLSAQGLEFDAGRAHALRGRLLAGDAACGPRLRGRLPDRDGRQRAGAGHGRPVFPPGRLVGIQNGVDAASGDSLHPGPAGQRLTRQQVLERAHPRYDEPTLGVLVQDELYYIGKASGSDSARTVAWRRPKHSSDRWCCVCGFDTSPGRNYVADSPGPATLRPAPMRLRDFFTPGAIDFDLQATDKDAILVELVRLLRRRRARRRDPAARAPAP